MRSAYFRRRSRPERFSFGGPFLFLVALGVLAFVIFRLAIFKLPLSSQRLNFVVAGPTVRLVSIDPAKKSIVEVLFPADLSVSETYHGYGRYNLGSVYAVGELDRRGGEVLAGTISEYVGVPVDGYLVSRGTGDIKAILALPEVLLSKSNLSLGERIEILLAVLQTRFDRISSVDLGNDTAPLVLADGSMARSLEKGQLDSILSGDFVEDKLRGENLRVSVVNSTDFFGLGNRAARILGNIGMDVTEVQSAGPAISSCEILARKKIKGSLTVARIAAIFSCQVKDLGESGQVDVTVVLGQDYVDRLTK